MLDVIDLLAFGPAMQPDERTQVDTWVERINYGQRAELLNNGALGALQLKRLGLSGRIDAKEFANDALTISPFNPNWLSPAFIACDLTLWGKREAVSYIDLTIDVESLGAWIGKLSGKEARSRG